MSLSTLSSSHISREKEKKAKANKRDFLYSSVPNPFSSKPFNCRICLSHFCIILSVSNPQKCPKRTKDKVVTCYNSFIKITDSLWKNRRNIFTKAKVLKNDKKFPYLCDLIGDLDEHFCFCWKPGSLVLKTSHWKSGRCSWIDWMIHTCCHMDWKMDSIHC